jgi:HAD superfamily hydrolase (TIGR01549 family)
LFDVVLPSRYIGIAKPDPEIFYEALRKAGVEGSEAVHVGDDYRKDYEGAKVRYASAARSTNTNAICCVVVVGA